MRKVFSVLLIVFVIVGVLTLSPQVFAQNTATESSAVATEEVQVEYPLAYPGILPDNPLYFLKATRDKLVSFLISDNEKKADFNLLTSDKRVNAAFMLATRGKGKLAVDTLSKSNNYLEEAIAALIATKKGGRDIKPHLNNVKNSIQKHQDMVVGIKDKLGSKYAQGVDAEAKRLLKFEKTVLNLLQK